MMGDPRATQATETRQGLADYPFLQALLGHRSRRFGKGMRLNGGP